jgi:hypothetical protein
VSCDIGVEFPSPQIAMAAVMKSASMRLAGVSCEVRAPERTVQADSESHRVSGSAQRQSTGHRTLPTAMASGSELPRSAQEHAIDDRP